MDGLKAINELNELNKELNKAIERMESCGVDYATEDAMYRSQLRQAILRMRDEGLPVTIIKELAFGEVSQQRQKMNIAEALYKTAQEKIQSVKLQMRLLDNQINREYGRQ